MIRVAIADDHHLFSDGLADALDAVPDLTVVGIAGDAAEAAELIGLREIDVDHPLQLPPAAVGVNRAADPRSARIAWR